jgi:tetratricopeptide (TPR) repeat protein
MFEQEKNNETTALSGATAKLKDAMSFGSAGKYESALMAIEEALALQENYADAWLMKGVILVKQGWCSKALKCFDKVIELNPKSAAVWHLKGATLVMLDKNDDAVECFRKAVALDPDNIELHLTMASSFQRQRRFEDALNCYENVLRLRPHDPRIPYLIGIMWGNMGTYEKALDSFETALRMKPDFTDAILGKAAVLAKLGRIDEAKLCAQQALETKGEAEKGKPTDVDLADAAVQPDCEEPQI